MGKSFKSAGAQAASKFISNPNDFEKSLVETNKVSNNDYLEINKVKSENISEKDSTQILDIKYLTTKEVAEILRITPRRIQQLINKNEIKADRIGRKWLIAESEAKRFISGN